MKIVYKSLFGQEVAAAFVGNSIAEKINTGRFDASNLPAGQAGLPSGIYFYTLRARGKVDTKRMLLMK